MINKTIEFDNLKFSIIFLLSGLALLLHILLEFNLGISLLFLASIGLVLFFYHKKCISNAEFSAIKKNITYGLLFGIAATASYDLIRIGLYSSGAIAIYPFETFTVFGKGIIGLTYSSSMTFATGLIYHFINGAFFSIAYVILFKNANWVYGLLWGLILEGVMLSLYPSWLNIGSNLNEFLAVSILGHVGYGVTLGVLNQNLPKIELANVNNMKWATRKNLKVDRIACVWLIRKFINPDAKILFVEENEIKKLTDEGVLTFDAADARFRHEEDYEGGKYGEKCTFQILLDEFNLIQKYPSLDKMGKILHAADIGHRINRFEPKSGFGLWVIAQGFSLTTPNDNEKLIKELPIYDAIYAFCENYEVK